MHFFTKYSFLLSFFLIILLLYSMFTNDSSGTNIFQSFGNALLVLVILLLIIATIPYILEYLSTSDPFVFSARQTDLHIEMHYPENRTKRNKITQNDRQELVINHVNSLVLFSVIGSLFVIGYVIIVFKFPFLIITIASTIAFLSMLLIVLKEVILSILAKR